MVAQLNDTMLTTAEAAALVGRSPGHFRKHAQEGRVEFVETPYGRLFPRSAVERYRDARDEAEAAKK